MNNPLAISVRHISKRYQLYAKPQDRLKQSLLRHFGKIYGHEFWALNDINFEVKQGEALGIIGPNGSGKSTLLQIIAGTLTPTEGQVQVNGRVAALLELGSGFNPEFTGRENVFLNGMIQGFSRAEMEKRFAEIEAFADIGQFIDQPVKLYSSGMFVRLAFAVQACVEPDVLIVDEALSVGDIFFQQKCIKRIKRLLENRTSLIFVTHDMLTVSSLCHRALLMTHGQIAASGHPKLVLEKYISLYYGHSLNSPSGNENPEHPTTGGFAGSSPVLRLQPIPKGAHRFGDGGMQILGFDIHTLDNRSVSQFEHEEMMLLTLEIKCNEDNLIPNVGFQIRNRFGGIVCGTNTWMLSIQMAPQKAGAIFQFTFQIQMMLGCGEYTVTVAVSSNESKPERIYDWIDQITKFLVVSRSDRKVDGLVYCPIKLISSVILSD